MLWLGVDFETTGLSTSEDRVIEIGAVLWDVPRKTPIELFSTLVYDPSYKKLDPAIVNLTGITDKDLKERGQPPSPSFSKLQQMLWEADFAVAHNGTNFDVPILKAEFLRLGLLQKDDIAWIDTSVDIPYPKTIQTRKLTHLACEHGFINPFPHRALFDVMTMLKITSCYSSDDIVKLALSPSVTIRALVSIENRKQAQERGYRWDTERKFWLKTIKECQLLEEERVCPFKISIIQGAMKLGTA